ncbi:MAG: hypothetical protein M1819_000952 [Sarea resinae]|nr:MAG: hypothetical protein M1819_000952 [Sarea resinae]
MRSVLALVALLLPLIYAVNWYRGLARNIREAKASGIPYVVLPVFIYNRYWLTTHRIWIPWLRKLPASWTESWIDFLSPEFMWLDLHEPFKRLGTDIILLVTPGKSLLVVADADAISEIANRRHDFPKPVEIYKAVSIFGENVVSTEGHVWRQHRKITSPPFTEKNNQMVWTESIHQAQSMLKSWLGPNGEPKTVSTVANDTMRLSLHVISRAGFGVRCLWPGVESEDTGDAFSSAKIQAGHTMSYKDALTTLLHNLVWLIVVPHWLLAILPFEASKRAYQAYTEWGKIMTELFQKKKAEILAGEEASSDGMDLMGALAKGAGVTATTKTDQPSPQLLTDSEIMGNAFVFILAGHETAANVLHFAFLHLALFPDSQRLLHDSLDEIFGSRAPETWDFDTDCPRLFTSMTGAVMNETLRVIPPVVNIPKCTRTPQKIVVGGKQMVVPGGAMVGLDVAAVHHNPKYWSEVPEASRTASSATMDEKDGSHEDLHEFNPSRWLSFPTTSTTSTTTPNTDTATTTAPSATPQQQLHHPTRGAFIPFSLDARSCLGRRFAQVEVLATLATVLRSHTVELDVHGSGFESWNQAADRARYLLKFAMGSMITLQMRHGAVGVRFVRREEPGAASGAAGQTK